MNQRQQNNKIDNTMNGADQQLFAFSTMSHLNIPILSALLKGISSAPRGRISLIIRSMQALQPEDAVLILKLSFCYKDTGGPAVGEGES